ncbi:hypothetical protein [Longimicrobium sp.]|uniref:hypothetical protein n=1 Tax=Longimicrobium sp. TaxID=2029185 RepID=UPI002E367039|nr:hypothetical protein [Longimicrobium sp.]HEX6041757.1 hypothetical protein [Longimicrobium sp.]
MLRVTLSAQALAAAMNAELYRRGVPAFVRVEQVVRAPAGEGAGGADWTFALERSPVPLHDDATADRFAEALFRHAATVDAVAEWAAQRFDVDWAPAPRAPVFIPSPEPAAHPPAGTPVAAE